jgi:chromosome segregation ATPase
VFESQAVGLKNEKQHLLLELTEAKKSQKDYEKKCGSLIQELNKTNLEFQESKREIIGFSEIQKEREDRIEKLKAELKDVTARFEDVDLKYGTLTIQNDKVRDQYETARRDLEDAIEKLHVTNKVRHETELKLAEETERARALQDVIRDKDEQLHKRAQEIEDLDRRVIELERTNENIEIKKASMERQAEITKKQLTEKISNLNDVLQSEKETREMWIERYEKEQKEHSATNAALLQTKSQLKD